MAKIVTKILSLDGFAIKRIFRLQSKDNAVFRCGGVVVKIFPDDNEVPGSAEKYLSEVYANERLQMVFMSAPKMLSHGELFAKYLFRYIIFTYIPGVTLRNIRIPPDKHEKREFAKQIFEISTLINRPEPDFNSINAIENAKASSTFDSMPESFKEQRLEAINRFVPNCYLFTHGNLTRDNFIIGHRDILYVTGFSHVCNAPIEYETANLVFDLFEMDKYYLRGFYGLYDSFELTERSLIGALIHENGLNILSRALGDISHITKVNELRDTIFRKIKIQ